MKTIFVIILIRTLLENGDVEIPYMTTVPAGMPSLIFDTREQCDSYQMQKAKDFQRLHSKELYVEQKIYYSQDGYLRIKRNLGNSETVEMQCIEINQFHE